MENTAITRARAIRITRRLHWHVRHRSVPVGACAQPAGWRSSTGPLLQPLEWNKNARFVPPDRVERRALGRNIQRGRRLRWCGSQSRAGRSFRRNAAECGPAAGSGQPARRVRGRADGFAHEWLPDGHVLKASGFCQTKRVREPDDGVACVYGSVTVLIMRCELYSPCSAYGKHGPHPSRGHPYYAEATLPRTPPFSACRILCTARLLAIFSF